MVIVRDKNILTITLNNNETKILDFMDSTSSLFFQSQIEKLFLNRGNQLAHEIKTKVSDSFTPEELVKLSDPAKLDEVKKILEANIQAEGVKL